MGCADVDDRIAGAEFAKRCDDTHYPDLIASAGHADACHGSDAMATSGAPRWRARLRQCSPSGQTSAQIVFHI
jgi:hypothetical protein